VSGPGDAGGPDDAAPDYLRGDAPTPDGWPVPIRGVVESVVATLGPNGLWNQAALGLAAPETADDPVTARTWGRTRTRRNFRERGGGVVQFTADPREFVDAALTIREGVDPVLPGAAAWVTVRAERLTTGESGGTSWADWALQPDPDLDLNPNSDREAKGDPATPAERAAVRRRTVPTINRGFGAVIDATVAVSRLDVPAYDTAALLDRLAYFADTVDRCGGPAEREAFRRIDAETGWRGRYREARDETPPAVGPADPDDGGDAADGHGPSALDDG